jgi:hypothetical protein
VTKKNLLIYILLIVYVLLFYIQFNQKPFERFPAFDPYWGNMVQAGKLYALRSALINGELPTINPFVEFGWNNIGDTTLPQSFVFPLNLLILFFSAQTIIILRTIILLIIGAIGAFIYIQYLTKDDIIAFLGALSYIGLPFIISMNFYYSLLNTLCYIPLFLFLIHKILEKDNAKKYFFFILLSLLAISSGDVHVFLIIPPILFIYTLIISAKLFEYKWIFSFRKSIRLVITFLLTGSFFIFPLFNNLKIISDFEKNLRISAGIVAPISTMTLTRFLNFFKSFGLPSLWKPIEGSGLLLYAPIVCYVTILIFYIFKKAFSESIKKISIIPITLLLSAGSMFLISIVFYAFPSFISSSAKGALRYQLNLIPFLVILASFISLSAISKHIKINPAPILLISILSFLLDFIFFVIPDSHPADSNLFLVRHGLWTGNADFKSSNLFPIRFHSDMWLLLPWINLFIIIIVIFYSYNKNRIYKKRGLCTVLMLIIIFAMLFNISLHNELRLQQGSWQIIFNNSYRWDSYLSRKKYIDKKISRNDANFRTLYVGENRHSDWNLISETELNTKEKQNVLFSYRETVHPFTGILYSALNDEIIFSNFPITLSRKVADHIELLRLMGIKYIVSMNEIISSPSLILKGQYKTDESNFAFINGNPLGGTIYIYELDKPMGIAFLVDKYLCMKWGKSIQTIMEKKIFPWRNNEVYLEEDPYKGSAISIGYSENQNENQKKEAKIIKEGFNEINLDISASSDSYLVLSYIYSPYWKAYMDSKKVNIYRAYGGFMSIKIPPGVHRVEMKYIPVDLYIGILLTVLTCFYPFVPRILLRLKKYIIIK